MLFLSFQRRSQPSDAWKFSTLNSLLNAIAFSWMMAADNGTFWLRILLNHFKIALSTNSKLPVLNFCRFTLDPFSSELKSFSLFLTHVDKVFLGTLYFAATSLLLIPFSKSFRAWHFSRKLLWLYLRFTATNILNSKQWTANDKRVE